MSTITGRREDGGGGGNRGDYNEDSITIAFSYCNTLTPRIYELHETGKYNTPLCVRIYNIPFYVCESVLWAGCGEEVSDIENSSLCRTQKPFLLHELLTEWHCHSRSIEWRRRHGLVEHHRPISSLIHMQIFHVLFSTQYVRPHGVYYSFVHKSRTFDDLPRPGLA